MRSISGPAASALASGRVALVLLVEMQLTSTLRLASSAVTISWGGFDWLGAGSLGAVEEVADTAGDYKSLRFVLSGVPASNLAIALAEPIRDKACILRLAVLDPDTHAVLDAPVVWTGTLDQMPVTLSGETCTIAVVAEHAGVAYARPKPLRYTDADQQRLYPGDTSLRFVVDQAQHQDVWPASSYFRR